MAKYLGLFVSEASEHVAQLGTGLVRLESAARDGCELGPLVDDLFRHAHSVKGMAASMELAGIAALAHTVEDLVAVFRGHGAAPDQGSVDVLLAAVDALGALVQQSAEGSSPSPDPTLVNRVSVAATRARTALGAGPLSQDGAGPGPSAGRAPALVAAPPGPASGAVALGRHQLAVEVEVAAGCAVPAVRAFLVLSRLRRMGTVARCTASDEDLRAGRLPGRRLEAILETAESPAEVERALWQISELTRVAVREETPAASPAAAFLPRGAGRSREAQDGGRTVRVRVELLDSFLDAVGELILATGRLREVGRGIPEPFRLPMDEGVNRLHVTVKDLHDKVMAVRMMPLAVVTERLPRAARDLARRTGKQVEVEVRGAEIELDRAILDELADPLLHVLRNAVDHGLEAPHLRQAAGKPATGHVTLTARRERDRVLVEVADDGQGMDPEALRASAVARGALGEDASRALDDREALLLACLPGVSTAREVTDVSGRGVGMDAVKRTVEALGGAVDVESARGVGTRWILRLPLTVAVQPVLLVGVGEEVLALPISKVQGAVQVDVAALDRSGGEPVMLYGGKLLPVRDLGELLGFPRRAGQVAGSVVVAESDGAPLALAVDALLGQQEAVLKPLARPFDRVAGLSAVTVLATGRPVFVLDVARLLPS